MNRLTQILLGTIVLLILMTSGIYAENVDETVFHLINRDLQSPYLDTPMVLITHSGDPLVYALTAGSLYLAGERDTATLLSSALAKTAWTSLALKNLISRPRPGLNMDDVHYVGDYVVKDDESFPSGHTALAFAAATVLSDQYPQYTPYLYTYATLIGVSRIYVGAHYPTDVLAGALLGYLVGKNTTAHRDLILGGNFLLYTVKF